MPAECVSSHGRLREDIHPVVVMASGEVEIAATISQVCRKARRTVLRLSPVFEQNVIPTARMGREQSMFKPDALGELHKLFIGPLVGLQPSL